MDPIPGEALTSCRMCGSTALTQVLDLGAQAACDNFPPADDPQPDARWPLALTMCGACRLVQLDHVSPPEEVARAVESETLRRHAHEVTERILDRLDLPERPRVREFSSHHGGSWIGAWTARGAQEVTREADVVIDNQSIIHSETPDADLAERVAALADGGMLVIEFHHALRQLTGGQFDTVRHGHPLYFSLHSWSAACERHGLTVVDAWAEDVFGGCLLVAARRGGAPNDAVRQILDDEIDAGATTPQGYERLRELTASVRAELVRHLEDAKGAGHTVAAYGAGSKSCTLLGATGIGPDLLPYTADLSPAKHGRRIPGVGVPIVGPQDLVDRSPDEVVILTWDIADEVIAQLRRSGLETTFVVPLPHVRVVGSS
ncbi:class I SAM-dependent methyltransferase [Mobilicoccus massiliensis]|uniref:class I SAM-dependent methyltransferase n=1 Tax=Mobilicoccus massiliensis TaxID=1522310 RepID=UPI0005912253|nr:class I SAM-dependent methyltransferase [Mobilicoccus massiliensis]